MKQRWRRGHIFPACSQYCCDKNLYRDAQLVRSCAERQAAGRLLHTHSDIIENLNMLISPDVLNFHNGVPTFSCSTFPVQIYSQLAWVCKKTANGEAASPALPEGGDPLCTGLSVGWLLGRMQRCPTS